MTPVQKKTDEVETPEESPPVRRPITTRRLQGNHNHALKAGEGGHGPSVTRKKQSIADAKAETTRPAKVRRSREGKSGLPVYVDKHELEDFKAIAAAKGKGAQQYLEEFISSTVANNAHLIPKGRELLKGPQRRRSFADKSLEQENRRLKAQLREAGLKPR